MNCAVDCDREVISMWPLGVIAGVIFAGAFARVFLGRDKVPPMERRLRALALLRDLAEQPRTIPDLVPPPEARTDHVRILEEAPDPERKPRRASAHRPANRRARAHRAGKPRSSASSAAQERPTIEIRSSVARVPGVLIAAAEPDTGVQAVPSSPSRFSSRVYAVTIAAAFVIAVIGVVAAVGLSGHGTARATASKSHQNRTAKPRSVASTATTAAPSTTAPAPVAPVVARSTNGATVSVHSPFRLTLRASGTCWVEITDATGHTVFTATLHSGQQQQIPGAGPIVVRLGYTPAMTISVDGIDLDLSGLGQTTNLTFQSA
jgi:hypothetical protein